VTRHYRAVPVGGEVRGGGSTWQSLVRGRPLEVDWLNGEIVLLGAEHGVPTPVNAALRRAANAAAASGMKPGPDALALLDRALAEERLVASPSGEGR
jgi:2-dehydropantoate 2-reductase